MEEIHCLGCRKQIELMSLRAKVKRLEDGRELKNLTALNEKLQRKLDKQQADNMALREKRDQLEETVSDLEFDKESLTVRVEKLSGLLEDRNKIIAETDRNAVEALKKEKAELQNTVEDLSGQVTKLTAQIQKNYIDSSKPSSMSPNHKKIVPNSRKQTGKKPGGQPGHEGHPREHLKPTKPPVILPAPKEAQEGHWEKTGNTRTRMMVDLHLSADVIPYVSEEYRDPATGKTIWSEFSENMPNEINYSNNVKALASLLNNYDNVSIRRTQETISALTGGKVNLSTGFISSLPALFAAKTEKQIEESFKALQGSPFMHADFTTIRVNGKNKNVLITSNNNVVLYTFRDHKGDEGLKDTPVDGYCFVLIHDHDITFYHYAKDHQECVVHILRYLIGSTENEPELTWAKQMHDLMEEMLDDAYKHTLTPEKSEAYKKRYDEILDIADQEYAGVSKTKLKYYPDGKNLAKRLREYKDETLFFLDHNEIDPDNNEAERDARKIKRKAHEVGSFRSDDSVRYFCNMLSIIVTQKNSGINAFQALVDGFSGQTKPAPSETVQA